MIVRVTSYLVNLSMLVLVAWAPDPLCNRGDLMLPSRGQSSDSKQSQGALREEGTFKLKEETSQKWRERVTLNNPLPDTPVCRGMDLSRHHPL